MKLSLRSVGSAAGVIAALAGGIGAAVGFYSLPDPTSASVGHNVYVRADERAIAVYTTENGDGTTTKLRIDAGRGGSAESDAGATFGQFPSAAGQHRVNVHFTAMIATCDAAGNCYNEQYYEAEPWMPMTVEIDPLLRNARFVGTIYDCDFDITWTGEGELAPFAGVPQISSGIGSSGAQAHAREGFAETSRVAPADIETCFGTFENANGYLSRGVRRTITGAGAQVNS